MEAATDMSEESSTASHTTVIGEAAEPAPIEDTVKSNSIPIKAINAAFDKMNNSIKRENGSSSHDQTNYVKHDTIVFSQDASTGQQSYKIKWHTVQLNEITQGADLTQTGEISGDDAILSAGLESDVHDLLTQQVRNQRAHLGPAMLGGIRSEGLLRSWAVQEVSRLKDNPGRCHSGCFLLHVEVPTSIPSNESFPELPFTCDFHVK